MSNEEFTAQIEKHLTGIYATFAEPSNYNRFHINRIKDLIDGRDTFYNETETERRFTVSDMSTQERLKWIAEEFANMVWFYNYSGNDYDQKEKQFKKEITSFDKAKLWCEIAEIQLVPKGLMIPNFETNRNKSTEEKE